jgi:hypothetical protein
MIGFALAAVLAFVFITFIIAGLLDTIVPGFLLRTVIQGVAWVPIVAFGVLTVQPGFDAGVSFGTWLTIAAGYTALFAAGHAALCAWAARGYRSGHYRGFAVVHAVVAVLAASVWLTRGNLPESLLNVAGFVVCVSMAWMWFANLGLAFRAADLMSV